MKNIRPIILQKNALSLAVIEPLITNLINVEMLDTFSTHHQELTAQLKSEIFREHFKKR